MRARWRRKKSRRGEKGAGEFGAFAMGNQRRGQGGDRQERRSTIKGAKSARLKGGEHRKGKKSSRVPSELSPKCKHKSSTLVQDFFSAPAPSLHGKTEIRKKVLGAEGMGGRCVLQDRWALPYAFKALNEKAMKSPKMRNTRAPIYNTWEKVLATENKQG